MWKYGTDCSSFSEDLQRAVVDNQDTFRDSFRTRTVIPDLARLAMVRKGHLADQQDEPILNPVFFNCNYRLSSS